MKQTARLDYLDLQIYEEQKTEVILNEVDSDGVSYTSTLSVHDALANEIFRLLEMPAQSSAWYSKVLYQSENKEVFISSKPLQKSLQFKGSFFLRADAIERLKDVIEFLKLRKINFLVSRIDISFVIQDRNIYKSLDRCDFKKLTQYTLKKNREIVYYKAYNSRFTIVAYGKSAQIKREKGDDYLKKFLRFYELELLPDDLVNFELRILGTDTCGKISEQILQEIDLDILKELILVQAQKRVKLVKKIYELLLKSSI